MRSFIPVPIKPPKAEEEKKSELEDDKKDCDKCKEQKCEDCHIEKEEHEKMEEGKKPLPGRKIRRPRKNRKAVNKQEGQCFFPMSMSILYGALGDPAAEATPPLFPYNVTFKQVNNLLYIRL